MIKMRALIAIPAALLLVVLVLPDGHCLSDSQNLWQRGSKEFAAGHWDKAKDCYMGVLDHFSAKASNDPRKLVCQYRLALIAQQTGNYGEALKLYERCLVPTTSASLSKAEVQARMAIVELKQGDKDQALALYQLSKKSLDDALHAYYGTDPNGSSSNEGQKRAAPPNKEAAELIAQRKYTEAIELLKVAERQDPQGTRDDLANAYLAYGNSLAANPQKAMQQYYQCLYQRRANAEALHGLDLAMRTMHKDPTKAQDQIDLAREAASSGESTGAGIHCAEALRIDPGALSPTSALYPHGIISLAAYYQGRKEYGKAIELLTAALQKIPQGDSDAAQAMLHWLAEIYEDAGDKIHSRLTMLREAEMRERLHEPSPVALIKIYDSLARAYAEHGDSGEARACWEKLVAKFHNLSPNDRTRTTTLCMRDACDFFEHQNDIATAAPILVDALDNYESVGWRDIDFDSYSDRVRQKLSKNWKPSSLVHKGPIVAQFKILRDGIVDDVHLVEGAGDAAAEEAAVKAVYDSEPLDRLPPDCPAWIDMQFKFN